MGSSRTARSLGYRSIIERRGRARCARRHRLHLRRLERDYVEHAIGQQTDLAAVNLHDDDDVQRRRLGVALAEAAAQIDDGHHYAAQVKQAAHVIGLIGQMGHGRPALDFSHRHDVDAILLVANRKADEVTPFRDYALRRAGGSSVFGRRCRVAAHRAKISLLDILNAKQRQRMGLKLSYRMNYISLFNLDSVAF